mgnify:CR=1 FL=1
MGTHGGEHPGRLHPVGVPRNPDKALCAIRESDGVAVNVSDGEILEAMRLLGRTQGVFGEPAGAAGTAGVKKAVELGLIPAGYKIMVVGSVQEEDCDGMCWQYIVNKFFPPRASARSRWSSWCPPSPLTAASTGATGAAWRSAWT